MGSPQPMHIAILGCGFMGKAILQGLSKARPSTPPLRFTACVRSEESRSLLQSSLSAYKDTITLKVNDFRESASSAGVVLLGVPPDQLKSLAAVEGLAKAIEGKTVISLLAGTSCSQIKNAFASQPSLSDVSALNIVRVIPTIGASERDSASIIAKTEHASQEHQERCKWLFDQIGSSILLPESQMDDATATGATAHALAFTGIDAMVDASVAEGLPRDVAMKIAAENLRSAANLIGQGKVTPESLKQAMSVPKSITINAALGLEKGGVKSGISDAVRHAIRYARGLNE